LDELSVKVINIEENGGVGLRGLLRSVPLREAQTARNRTGGVAALGSEK